MTRGELMSLNQHDRIIWWLRQKTKDGKPFRLSPMKAFTKLGITKLSTRIGELRRAGYDISDEWVKPKRGKSSPYKEYWLT